MLHKPCLYTVMSYFLLPSTILIKLILWLLAFGGVILNISGTFIGRIGTLFVNQKLYEALVLGLFRISTKNCWLNNGGGL